MGKGASSKGDRPKKSRQLKGKLSPKVQLELLGKIKGGKIGAEAQKTAEESINESAFEKLQHHPAPQFEEGGQKIKYPHGITLVPHAQIPQKLAARSESDLEKFLAAPPDKKSEDEMPRLELHEIAQGWPANEIRPEPPSENPIQLPSHSLNMQNSAPPIQKIRLVEIKPGEKIGKEPQRQSGFGIFGAIFGTKKEAEWQAPKQVQPSQYQLPPAKANQAPMAQQENGQMVAEKQAIAQKAEEVRKQKEAELASRLKVERIKAEAEKACLLAEKKHNADEAARAKAEAQKLKNEMLKQAAQAKQMAREEEARRSARWQRAKLGMTVFDDLLGITIEKRKRMLEAASRKKAAQARLQAQQESEMRQMQLKKMEEEELRRKEEAERVRMEAERRAAMACQHAFEEARRRRLELVRHRAGITPLDELLGVTLEKKRKMIEVEAHREEEEALRRKKAEFARIGDAKKRAEEAWRTREAEISRKIKEAELTAQAEAKRKAQEEKQRAEAQQALAARQQREDGQRRVLEAQRLEKKKLGITYLDELFGITPERKRQMLAEAKERKAQEAKIRAEEERARALKLADEERQKNEHVKLRLKEELASARAEEARRKEAALQAKKEASKRAEAERRAREGMLRHEAELKRRLELELGQKLAAEKAADEAKRKIDAENRRMESRLARENEKRQQKAIGEKRRREIEWRQKLQKAQRANAMASAPADAPAGMIGSLFSFGNAKKGSPAKVKGPEAAKNGPITVEEQRKKEEPAAKTEEEHKPHVRISSEKEEERRTKKSKTPGKAGARRTREEAARMRAAAKEERKRQKEFAKHERAAAIEVERIKKKEEKRMAEEEAKLARKQAAEQKRMAAEEARLARKQAAEQKRMAAEEAKLARKQAAEQKRMAAEEAKLARKQAAEQKRIVVVGGAGLARGGTRA